MDPEFINIFDTFNLNLVALNYKFKTNAKLNDNDKKNISLLKIIIPIFDRIKHDGDIDLNNIISEPVSTCSFKNEVAPFLQLRIDTDSDGYLNEFKSDEETSEDPTGDLQVNNLTEQSLKILKLIKNNNWAQIEVVSDIEIEIEDDGEESEETVPLLVTAN